MSAGLFHYDDFVNRLIRYPGAIAIRIRIARLRLLGVSVGRKCWIRRVRIPRNPWDIVIEDFVSLDDDVVLLTTGLRREHARLVVGSNTYVNRFTMFDASERIVIGQNCLIGPFCYVTDHDHGTKSIIPKAKQSLLSSPVQIGRNVWIGAGVVILKGVNIGNGAVIGAGAVVTRDVGPEERVAGVPARAIGFTISPVSTPA